MDPDLASVTQEAKSIIVVQNTDIVEDPTNPTPLKITAMAVSIIKRCTICKCYSFENIEIKVLSEFLLSWQII